MCNLKTIGICGCWLRAPHPHTISVWLFLLSSSSCPQLNVVCNVWATALLLFLASMYHLRTIWVLWIFLLLVFINLFLVLMFKRHILIFNVVLYDSSICCCIWFPICSIKLLIEGKWWKQVAFSTWLRRRVIFYERRQRVTTTFLQLWRLKAFLLLSLLPPAVL